MGVLVRRRGLIIRCAVLLPVVVTLAALLFPARYTSTTTFVPEVSSNRQLPAGLAGLAGQLGLSLGGNATTSPRFFADVLKSRATMERVLRTRFANPDGTTPGDSASLLALLEVEGDSPLDSLENGRRDLADRVTTRVDAETGIISLSVSTGHRELSAAVANAFLRYLDEFNTESRQSKAAEQREFVERRLAQSADELRQAELGLKHFYETNRTWQQSPQLSFIEGQLRRRVDVVQEVYLTLSREYEKARIEEVNDTPALTIIDAAVPVQERASPRFGLLAVMAFVLGLGGGVLLALGREYVERLRVSDPEGHQRLMALLPRFRRRPA